MKKKSEYRNFTRMVDKILSVPNEEVRHAIEAEKAAKKQKKPKKSSASREAI